MIIVLEGADGTGKTTLAKRLCDRLNASYIHMSVPDPINKPFDYWWSRIEPILARGSKALVIDRLLWSEEVYGSLFRGGSALTDLDRWQLEGWLLAQGAVIVRCRPPLEVVLKNTQRDAGGLHHGQAEAVYRGFNAPWQTPLPVVNFDFTREPIDGFVRDVTELVRGRAVLDFAHEGIGAARPEIVLVADRHNTCNERCFSPFVLRCPAGDYLRRALALAGLTLSQYQVINGWRLAGAGGYQVNDSVLALRSPGRHFIALGREAERALRLSGISDFGFAYHPQHAKRFHYRDLSKYAATLAGQAQ